MSTSPPSALTSECSPSVTICRNSNRLRSDLLCRQVWSLANLAIAFFDTPLGLQVFFGYDIRLPIPAEELGSLQISSPEDYTTTHLQESQRFALSYGEHLT